MKNENMIDKQCHCEEATATIRSEEVGLSNKRSGLPRSHSFSRNDRKSVITLAEVSITSPQPSPRGEGEVVGEHNANHTNSGEVKKAAFTPLVKAFRSGWDSLLCRWHSQAHNPRIPSFANAHSSAFTLAETLITLSILGIVAAITIPVLIGRQVDSQNRSKVRKAMAAYERAINQMLIDNDLQTEDSFIEWANNDATTKNYAGQRGYFKIAEESTSYPNCRFKTGDGVWWDICGDNKSNIENPILILDKSYKDTQRTGDNGLEALAKTENDANGKKAYVFAMVGHRDATTGSVRVNDKAYEDSVENNTENQQYLEKTLAFMNNEKVSTDSDNGTTITTKTNTDKLADCATSSAATCKIITSYDCEKTQENPDGACELKMTKLTFNIDTCTTLYNGQTSCPEKPINYVVIPESENGKSGNDARCPDGTRKANSGELLQLWNNGTEGSILYENCAYCYFWAQEDDHTNGYDYGYLLDTAFNNMSLTTKDVTDDVYRTVCVGN